MRTQQRSHQTLNSTTTVLSTFGAFSVFMILVGLSEPFLEAENSRGGVVGLVFAGVQTAGQDEFSCDRQGFLVHAFAAVQSKRNGSTAFLATHTQIPAG